MHYVLTKISRCVHNSLKIKELWALNVNLPVQVSCKNFCYSFELQRDKKISKRKLTHQRRFNSYVNPVLQAKEYARILKEEGLSKGKLANRLGVSRVRVSQILNLLKLPKDRQDYVLKHGKEELITERMLRKVVSG